MSIRSEETAVQVAGEETPLLEEQGVGVDGDDRSSETLTDHYVGDIDENGNPDNANRQVGRVRGLLIILDLLGWIFLQGQSALYTFVVRRGI